MNSKIKEILKEQFEIENSVNTLNYLVQTLKTAFDSNVVNSEEPFYLEPLISIIFSKTNDLKIKSLIL